MYKQYNFFLSYFHRCFQQHAVVYNATTILMQVTVTGFCVVNEQEN